MRFIVLLLAYSAVVQAQTFTANSYLNSSNLIVGSLASDPLLNGGRIGTGSWSEAPGGSNSAYTSLWGATNLSLTLPWVVNIGGTTFAETGTIWARSFLTNSAPATIDESAGFQSTGGSGGTFSNMTIRCAVDLHSTNSTGTSVNFDLLALSGNDECVCQLQTGNGLYRFITHAVNGTNGSAIDLSPGYYAIRLTRQQLPKTCFLEVWQWTGSAWTSLGNSTGHFAFDSTQFNSWWCRIQPNYLLSAGIVTGYHMWGAVALSYDAGDLIANNNIPRVNGQFRALRLSQ